MAVEWYCRIAGKEFGPLSSDDLRAMVAEGSLTPNHLVKRGADGNWAKAGNVKGLFATSGELTIDAEPAEAEESRPAERKLKRAKPAAEAKPTVTKAVKPLDIPVAQAVVPPPPVANPPAAVPTAVVQPAMTGYPPVGGVPRVHVGGAVAGTPARPADDPAAGGRKKKKNTSFLVSMGAVGVAVVGAIAALIWSNMAPSASEGSQSSKVAANKKTGKPEDLEKDVGSKPATAGSTSGTPKAETTDKPDSPKSPAGTAEPGTTGEPKWVDAAKESIRRGDVEVKIKAVQAGIPTFTNKEGHTLTTKSEYLLIRLELKSLSAERKPIYNSWSQPRTGISLKDSGGKVIGTALIRGIGVSAFADGQQEEAKVPIEGVIEDTLLFHKPKDKFKYLRLTLPGAGIGDRQPLEFEIPAAMLGELPPPKKPGETQPEEPEDGAAGPEKPLPEKRPPKKEDPDDPLAQMNKDIDSVGVGGNQPGVEPAVPPRKPDAPAPLGPSTKTPRPAPRD